MTRTYTYGDYIDEVIGVDIERDKFYLHQGLNMNIEAVSDNHGALLERYEVEPFGRFVIKGAIGTTLSKCLVQPSTAKISQKKFKHFRLSP